MGSPFHTTLSRSFPKVSYGLYGYGVEGMNNPLRAAERTGRFITWWAEFACVAVLPFVAIAIWRGLWRQSLRWFDLMLPAVILFFVFYPDGGGHQYGPRYWFIGWVTVPLTLGASFADDRPWTLGRWRFDPVRLAALQIAAYAGFLVSYSVFAHLQVLALREPLRVAATAPAPAMVLVHSDQLRFVPWQVRSIGLDAMDTTRNGPSGFDGPTLHGIDFGNERTALLCQQVRNRTIWRIRLEGIPPVGRLERVCKDMPG